MATGELEYLDEEGLLALWAKIKATFLLKAGDTATGDISMPHLKITDTTQSSHIEFSRQGWNYITVPSTNGVLAINMVGTSQSTTSYAFTGTELRPGSNNAFSLGTASYQWNNIYGTTIYENGTSLASKYAGITVESYFTNGVANNALRLSNTSKVGDTNRPVYFTANGVPSQISYTIGRNVAAGEDVTAYTAGDSIDITSHVVKVAMTAQESPTASGNTISFIDTVSQDADGTISATKKTVRSASTSQSGVVTTGEQSFAGSKTFTSSVKLGSAGSPASLLMFSRVSGGTAQTAMRFATGSDLFIIGEGSRSLGYATDLHGYKINMYYGTNPDSSYGYHGFILNESGNVGIGTASPSTKLHVNGTATVKTLKISDTSAVKHIEFSRVNPNYIVIPSGSGLYINVNGAASTTKAYRFTSSYFEPCTNADFSLGSSDHRWNNIYGTVLDISGATTLGSTLSVTGGTTLGSFLKMPNDQYISFKNSGGTDIRSVAMGGNNAFLLGDYQNNGGIPTHIHGSLVTLNVGGVKKAEVDSLGVTSYGGVAAMGIADLSIN